MASANHPLSFLNFAFNWRRISIIVLYLLNYIFDAVQIYSLGLAYYTLSLSISVLARSLSWQFHLNIFVTLEGDGYRWESEILEAVLAGTLPGHFTYCTINIIHLSSRFFLFLDHSRATRSSRLKTENWKPNSEYCELEIGPWLN